MEFEVTEEIYEYFKDRAIKINDIKKIIPNYMDYAKRERTIVDCNYQYDISERMNKIICNERIITTPAELVNKIYDAFCDGDKTVESQNFSILYAEYSGFNVYSVNDANVIERDNQVLTRLSKELVNYKTKRTKQLKIPKELLAIAGNEELMQELLKLREQINVGKS